MIMIQTEQVVLMLPEALSDLPGMVVFDPGQAIANYVQQQWDELDDWTKCQQLLSGETNTEYWALKTVQKYQAQSLNYLKGTPWWDDNAWEIPVPAERIS
jgi:hypothetical protein